MQSLPVRSMPPPGFSGTWKRRIALVVIAALLVSGLPRNAFAKWRDKSGELPGTVSSSTIAIIAIAGGAAVVTLLILAKKKGKKEVVLDVRAPQFKDVGGEPVARSASITNLMGDPITIKQLTLEGEDSCFSLSDARQVPFTVAPGEQVDLTVNYAPAAAGSLKGHLRIVASSPKVKKDTVKVVSFSASKKSGAESPSPIPEGIILPSR